MSEFNLVHVVGARPNFMKIAPLLRAAERVPGWTNLLVHTGQHYDEQMSDAFFRDLGIREPDMDLGIGSGSHGEQTGRVLIAMETVLRNAEADMVVVVGDVNSTVASALAAAKLGVGVAHVEAGLRSGDRRMPEELNRIVTDQLSDLCLTPSEDAVVNLRREGISEERIQFVGNIMIDSLLERIEAARDLGVPGRFGLEAGGYFLVTLHRPANVDDPDQLEAIAAALRKVALDTPVLFPVHPRTRKNLDRFGIDLGTVKAVDPVGYLDSLGLQAGALAVLTDSGGMQEETTVLGVPCLTLRDSTERPVTISHGTNRLVPVRSTRAILEAIAGLQPTRPDPSRSAPTAGVGRTYGRPDRRCDPKLAS